MNENKMGRCAVTVCDNYALVENVVETHGQGEYPPLRVYLCATCFKVFGTRLAAWPGPYIQEPILPPYKGGPPRESISPQQFKREMYGDWPGFSSDPAEPRDDGAKNDLHLSKAEAEELTNQRIAFYGKWGRMHNE